MRWALGLLAAVLAQTLCADEAIHLQVDLMDLGQSRVARRTVQLVPISPYPRTMNGYLFTREPKTLMTSTNGTCVFSNVVWGVYRLDVTGNPASSYSLTIGTNLTGTVSAAAVVVTPGTLPPNPATNYYTVSHIDALVPVLAAGSNVTISVTGNTHTISSTGDGGGSTLWTSSGGDVYPNGTTGSDDNWTATGGDIYPQ